MRDGVDILKNRLHHLALRQIDVDEAARSRHSTAAYRDDHAVPRADKLLLQTWLPIRPLPPVTAMPSGFGDFREVAHGLLWPSGLGVLSFSRVDRRHSGFAGARQPIQIIFAAFAAFGFAQSVR